MPNEIVSCKNIQYRAVQYVHTVLLSSKNQSTTQPKWLPQQCAPQECPDCESLHLWFVAVPPHHAPHSLGDQTQVGHQVVEEHSAPHSLEDQAQVGIYKVLTKSC